MPNIIGQEIPSNKPYQTQVYLATHDGEGKRLPLMHRSFISLKYDGIWCEDLNLIAVIEGDRMERSIYANFTDTVTNSDVVDGQFYWNTSFNNNTLSVTFSTDGITEMELNEIKRWLRPGKVKELILSENPNRAILARVSDNAPTYSMLPFEQYILVTIAGRQYKSSTTLYKGDIKVTFVMDDPFWYAINNILDCNPGADAGTYNSGTWINANGEEVIVFSDPDAVKIIAEDGIPVTEMISASNILFGNNLYALSQSQVAQEIAGTPTGNPETGALNNTVVAPGSNFDTVNISQLSGDNLSALLHHYAIVGYARLGNILLEYAEGSGPNLPQGDKLYFYYPGTAPSGPKISFEITPIIDTVTGHLPYIISPINSFAPGTNGETYNTITIEGVGKKELRFTTPSIYTAYNQAVKIISDAKKLTPVDNITDPVDLAQLRKDLRDGVNHYAARAYAIYSVDVATSRQVPVEGSTTTITAVSKSAVLANFANFLKAENSQYFSATIEIDCESGQAIGTFSYRGIPTTGEDSQVNLNIVTGKKEEIGDMIRSNYLRIEERNYPTDEGYIVTWGFSHFDNNGQAQMFTEGQETEQSKQYSHRLYHNVVNGLDNFSIHYRYYYY